MRSIRKYICHGYWMASLMVLAFSTTARAHEGHGTGAAGTAATATSAACVQPSVACARSATPVFGPNGKVWLVWSHDNRVYLSQSEDGGNSFAAPVAVTEQLATLDDNSEARPRLVLLADGSLLLVLIQRDSHYVGRLFTARSVDGGQSFSALRAMMPEVGQRFATPLVLPSGRLVMAWLDLRNRNAAKARGQSYKDTGVAVAWSDDNGQSFQGKSILADYSCDCCRMAGAVGPDGRAVFAWRHVFDGTTRDHAAAQLNDDGTLGPLRRIAVDGWKLDACPMHGPSMAIGADGTWHVTWYTGAPGKAGLYYARSLDQGATFSAPERLGNSEGKPARPQVLAAEGAMVWRAWKAFDGVTTTVQVQHSTDNGATWNEATEAARTQGASDHPLLVAHDGQVYLSWLTRDEGYRLKKLNKQGT